MIEMDTLCFSESRGGAGNKDYQDRAMGIGEGSFLWNWIHNEWKAQRKAQWKEHTGNIVTNIENFLIEADQIQFTFYIINHSKHNFKSEMTNLKQKCYYFSPIAGIANRS